MAHGKGTGKPRILSLDVENSPHLVYSYDLWGANISPDKIVEPARLLCWAGKWYGKSSVIFASEYHDGVESMLDQLWQVLDEADIIVTYNGVRHDLPIILRTLLENGYPPPSPWHDIDLYQVVKRRYKFASNRLGYVTQALGLETKLETGVAQLWKKVLDEDDKAWSAFRRYNKQDTIVTELLFRALLPIIKMPHLGLWSGDMSSCPRCGSMELTPAGIVTTKTSAYMKCVCICKSWCKMLANGETRPI
jgi:hypothetical protein